MMHHLSKRMQLKMAWMINYYWFSFNLRRLEAICNWIETSISNPDAPEDLYEKQEVRLVSVAPLSSGLPRTWSKQTSCKLLWFLGYTFYHHHIIGYTGLCLASLQSLFLTHSSFSCFLRIHHSKNCIEVWSKNIHSKSPDWNWTESW